MTMRKLVITLKTLGTLALALCGLFTGPLAMAQGWPAKPVKIYTAFAAGSASDIIARL